MVSQDFLQDYVEEVREHLIDMEKSLLLLEREGVDKEQIAQVFRAAHSIKGASACMGFEGLTNLTHELESLIAAVQSSARSVPQTGITLMLDCVDLISKAVDHVKQNGCEPAIDSSLLENLHEAFAKDGLSPEKPHRETPACPREPFPLMEEEDEELLAIFVSSFRENLSNLFDLLDASTRSDFSDSDREQILESVEKLISSARYMDYEPIVAQLELWAKGFEPGEASRTTRRKALEELEAHAAGFARMVPQLAIPCAEQPPAFSPASPIEEEDQELFSIFLDSFQQNLAGLAKAISGRSPDKINLEKASELTAGLIQSSRYMDYARIVEFLEDWEGSLSAFKEMDAADLGPLREKLSAIAEKIKGQLTDLNLPGFPRESPGARFHFFRAMNWI